ncbi:hypothetical protein AB1N83_006530 [Pleurotus pulmonarius]
MKRPSNGDDGLVCSGKDIFITTFKWPGTLSSNGTNGTDLDILFPLGLQASLCKPAPRHEERRLMFLNPGRVPRSADRDIR